MGRLSEAFKFINVDPDRFCGLWIKENMTSLSVTPELKKIRSENLSVKRSSQKELEAKQLKERTKKSKAVEYFSDLEAMEIGLISRKEFEDKHGSIA
jgi:hypothetical protein